jgi:hypothetical protein
MRGIEYEPKNDQRRNDCGEKKHFLPTAYLYHQDPLHLVRAQGAYVYDD